MAFALSPKRTGPRLGASLRQILLEQIDAAQRLLAVAALTVETEAEAIHAARKACKRVRTMVRLLYYALGPLQGRVVSEQVAHTARQLSSVRDEQMLSATLGKLREETDDAELLQQIEQVSRSLLPLSQASIENMLRQQVLQELRDLRSRVDGLGLVLPLGKAITKGVARLWRRMRQAYRVVHTMPSTENFHRTRKRIKDCFYAVCLLRPLRPRRMVHLKKNLERLADDLGFEHDLAILAERIRYDPFVSASSSAHLLTHVAIRRERLQHAAHRQIRSLWRWSPKRLAKVMCRTLRKADEA